MPIDEDFFFDDVKVVESLKDSGGAQAWMTCQNIDNDDQDILLGLLVVDNKLHGDKPIGKPNTQLSELKRRPQTQRRKRRCTSQRV